MKSIQKLFKEIKEDPKNITEDKEVEKTAKELIEEYKDDKYDDVPKVEKILDSFKAVEEKTEVVEPEFLETL